MRDIQTDNSPNDDNQNATSIDVLHNETPHSRIRKTELVKNRMSKNN